MQSHTFTRTRGISLEAQPTKMVHHISESNEKVSALLFITKINNLKQNTNSQYPPTYDPNFHDNTSVQKIKYKQLGNTKMIVSNIAFGKL